MGGKWGGAPPSQKPPCPVAKKCLRGARLGHWLGGGGRHPGPPSRSTTLCPQTQVGLSRTRPQSQVGLPRHPGPPSQSTTLCPQTQVGLLRTRPPSQPSGARGGAQLAQGGGGKLHCPENGDAQQPNEACGGRRWGPWGRGGGRGGITRPKTAMSCCQRGLAGGCGWGPGRGGGWRPGQPSCPPTLYGYKCPQTEVGLSR